MSRTSTQSPGQRLLARLGPLLFLLGLGPGLYLSFQVFSAKTSAAFSLPIVAFVPYEWSDHLRCPAMLASDEAGSIFATVDNPSAETIEYSARVAAGQTFGDGRSPERVILSTPGGAQASPFRGRQSIETEGAVPPYGAVDLTWEVRLADQESDAIWVNLDAVIGGTYYRDSCGILLAELFGLSGREAVVLMLSVMLLGGGLWLYGRWPLGWFGIIATAIGGALGLFILWMLY